MMEIWKEIDDYNGDYLVSNLGRVKSLKYGKERILKPQKQKTGYLTINLCKNGKMKTSRINRLVAEAFLPNPKNLPEVDHINSDKMDNRVENLQWISRVENNRKKETGIAISRRVQCVETGEIFESVSAAAKAVNRCISTMSRHLLGETQTCAGKHFKYYDEDVIDSDANSILFGIRQKDLI